MEIFGKLRSIKSEELELMLLWRNSPTVRANMYTQHEISLHEHKVWWERMQRSVDQRYFMYEIDNCPLGIVGFNKIDLTNSNSSWAFYASPESPRGTGSRMEFLALEYAFNELKLNKLYCEVLAFNQPVIKLHEKFGFKVEGIFREQHKVDSNYVDVYRMGILSQEWFEKKSVIREKLEQAISG